MRVGTIAALLLGVWEFVAPAVDQLIMRPPSAIFRAFFELTRSGRAAGRRSAQSLRGVHRRTGRVAVGAQALFLGDRVGPLARRLQRSTSARDALYSVPSVALVPLIAVAFKYQGDAPRVATVALFAIFPVLINTQQGVRNVDRGLLEVARAFNTSERRLWTDVIVPAALPFVLAGVRLAIGRALIGMIVSEFLVGLVGLGYLIIEYENVFRIDRMFVPVIVVAAMGIFLMGLVQAIEGRVAPWLRREQ